jgi:hypothetical protein
MSKGIHIRIWDPNKKMNIIFDILIDLLISILFRNI